MTTPAKIASIAAGLALVVGTIAYLSGFNASEVACDKLDETRQNLQSQYDQAVAKSVEVYADEKALIDEALSSCLQAKPKDPCADEQKAFDEKVNAFNSIKSPPDDAPYAEFQAYFQARDKAYEGYPAIRDALFACRANNPSKDVPYEKSDTKQCFDAYDAGVASINDTFHSNTQALRAALASALASLEARKKACNPPTGTFTDPPPTDGGNGEDGTSTGENTTPVEIANCRPLPDPDGELLALQRRAGEIQTEINDVQTSIDNAKKRIKQLEVERAGVPTSTPVDENGNVITNLALANAKRGQRIENIDGQIEYYNNFLERKNTEKTRLESELKDVNTQIAARQAYITKENQARQRAFPTNIHISKPDKCEYFHCHGTLCGKSDPAPGACGHGPTTEDDKDCKKFFNSYLRAAGA